MLVDWDLIRSYAGLLSLAVFCVYTGAHASLPKGTVRDKKHDDQADQDDEEEEEQERMSMEDAWLFPIIGSGALLGLYLFVRYIGEAWLNWLLGWYFCVAGVGSVWNSLVSVARHLCGEKGWRRFDKVEVRVHKGGAEYAHIWMRTPSIVLFPLAVVPSTLYLMERSAIVTNVLGVSFAANAIGLLRLDSFKTGVILLAGLFVYDVWWVFGTEVMVKVATSLDVPIKLLWPKASGYTMLGLGDIVIPGTFVALGLRYDRACGRGEKPYFWTLLVAYVVGLVTTMGVMHWTGRAQPALLYLSPGCVLGFIWRAGRRGEISRAWEFVDGNT